MPALRTPPTRRVLIDPAVPPPGSLSVTFGAGLALSELSVLSVAFGTAEGQVAQGEKLLGAPPIDTTGALEGELLRYDALAGAFKPSADLSPSSTGPTSNAAWTTIASATIAEDTVALLDAEVVGVKSDLSAGYAASGQAGFVNAGGTVTELESLVITIGDPTRVQLVISGAEVELQVQGINSEDWTWRARITRRLEIGP